MGDAPNEARAKPRQTGQSESEVGLLSVLIAGVHVASHQTQRGETSLAGPQENFRKSKDKLGNKLISHSITYAH